MTVLVDGEKLMDSKRGMLLVSSKLCWAILGDSRSFDDIRGRDVRHVGTEKYIRKVWKDKDKMR